MQRLWMAAWEGNVGRHAVQICPAAAQGFCDQALDHRSCLHCLRVMLYAQPEDTTRQQHYAQKCRGLSLSLALTDDLLEDATLVDQAPHDLERVADVGHP